MENAHDNSFNELCTHATTDAAQRYINASVPDVNVPSILGCLKDRKIDDDKKFSLSRRIDALIRLEEDRKGYKESYNFTQTDEIKRYCLDRLEEIRVINEVFHVPSGFVCIAAFIGFLSRLAYGTATESDDDNELFKRFVNDFLPQQYPKDEMYSVFRCGIVHAMSFYSPKPSSETSEFPTTHRHSKLLITHGDEKDHLTKRTVEGRKIPILVASKLCSDLEDAINKMFLVDSVVSNSGRFMAWQPAITGSFNKTSSDIKTTTGSSLSGEVVDCCPNC